MQENLREAEWRIGEARRTGAESLNLGDLALSELPASLGDLPHLEALSLGMARITGAGDLDYFVEGASPTFTDLQPLAGLRTLKRLYLTECEGITDLAPLAQIQALQRLELSSCTGVTGLAPLAQIQSLQRLDLSFCTSVTDFAPLAQLQALQRLNLHGCQTALSAKLVWAFADHSHLTELVADKAVGLPREILSRSLIDNCLPRLRAYLAELALGAEAENEVKVILLGNGRVGKTQLCRRFRGEPFDETVASTHGVQIWREKLRIRTGNQEQIFQVNWWDFGGQDIYHGTHALFMRSRAVFLILWTPQLENRDEFLENGIPLRNQPLAYWLDYVRTLAGEDSPVIVVQSQCDRITDRRPPPARLDGPGFFEASYSAKENQGRDTLEAHLRDAMRYLLDRHGALEIGHGRAEVRRRLYDWRSKDQKRKPEKRRHRTLTVNEFRALCDRVGGIVSWEHALDYFHQTGVVFYQPDLFVSRIVLDQNWALEAVYTVFHRGRAAPWLRDSGRFTREDLAWLAWQEHSPDEQKLFLGLMESCGVCFQCGETAQGEPRYVAPDLLPGFEAVKGRLHAWKENPGTPTLRLEYRFFHQAVIRRLMRSIGWQAGDLAEYWKYGFWFKDGQRGTQALVQFEDTSTDEAPGAGALVLKAQGHDPLSLLREIRRLFSWQWVGEEHEELLTLDGITVARSALAAGFDGRVLDQQKKPVPAAAFAAFFEDREHAPGKPAQIEISPQPLTENEKPREVFISYAWGDDTNAGQARAKIVNELQSALEKDGFVPVRDRDRLRPGDRISAFMRQLTRADLVVAVISKKYLRSFYCMYEIHKLRERCQGDADDLARRVVPIVLPEVKIGNALKRAPYVRYWKAEEKKLEKLHREMGLSLSPESMQEARLVREFANSVDDILVFLNDILMPRQLEAHLDHGFPAVREALQRRISEK